jgi:hypothetical protein
MLEITHVATCANDRSIAHRMETSDILVSRKGAIRG